QLGTELGPLAAGRVGGLGDGLPGRLERGHQVVGPVDDLVGDGLLGLLCLGLAERHAALPRARLPRLTRFGVPTRPGCPYTSAGIDDGVSSTRVPSLRQRSTACSPSRRLRRRGSSTGATRSYSGSLGSTTRADASTSATSDCLSLGRATKHTRAAPSPSATSDCCPLERATSSTRVASGSPSTCCSDPPTST